MRVFGVSFYDVRKTSLLREAREPTSLTKSYGHRFIGTVSFTQERFASGFVKSFSFDLKFGPLAKVALAFGLVWIAWSILGV